MNTKSKILRVAIKLFSDKGYAETSMRHIASAAEVNLAAINYHFISKENLYQEALKSVYDGLNQSIIELYQQNKQIRFNSFCIEVFNKMIEDGDDLISRFKLLISANIDFKDSFFGSDCRDFGPPGASALYELLKIECPSSKDEDVLWAVQVIFNQIGHTALILASPFGKAEVQKGDWSKEEEKQSLNRLIKILKHEITSSL